MDDQQLDDPYLGTVHGTGAADRLLGGDELGGFLEEHLAQELGGAERVLVVVPDRTRVAPVAEIAGLFRRVLHGRVAQLDYLVALGTHAPMADDDLRELVGLPAHPREAPRRQGPGWIAYAPLSREPLVANHHFDVPERLAELGAIPSALVAEASGGRLAIDVPVQIDRLVLDYDRLLVVSPVLPHEVAGFSGGNKYLFPGIGAAELTDASHWLGALITSRATIGRLGVSPVRAVIDAAAALVPVPRTCLALVTGRKGGVCAAYLGDPEPAWAAAAAVSSAVHVTHLDVPVERALSVVPERYPDMWTAAKAMYKVEPVVAEDGEVVVYAPHVREFSAAHGHDLARVGYHVRDWHLAHWDELQEVPWRVLAHSTHLAGDGTYDPAAGEHARIRVTLATGIDEVTCRTHGLGYLDPAAVDAELAGEPRPDTMVELDAGENLYRLAEDW